METTEDKMDGLPLAIDYDYLMDLRIDFAFKNLFSKGSTRPLISLLNAIFANKKIPRIIKSVLIKNPYMDKESIEDKLSILDIRAELEDGTDIIIEIHMFGLGELKAKTIRSWARVFGEGLEAGDDYSGQMPTIAIAFANGQVKPLENAENASGDKIHRLCKIMDCEDFIVFTDAMELHYIDMSAFAKAVNEAGSLNVGDAEEAMFAKWLSVITQKEIVDKAIVEDAFKDEEEIQMAVTALARQSKDKIARQAYQRRKDELFYYNKNMRERDEYKLMAEQEHRRAEQAESALAEKDAIIAELRSQLDKNKK
jgi:predicted transposase/invertase (TIGR01784 family)